LSLLFCLAAPSQSPPEDLSFRFNFSSSFQLPLEADFIFRLHVFSPAADLLTRFQSPSEPDFARVLRL
jgi:hypothetical protein